jgi:long-chain fatty acid transport protein
MKNIWRWILASAMCIIELYCTSPFAMASGYLNILQNASSAGQAGAGATALGEDAATIWYNPAGMVLAKRPEVLLTGGLTFPSISFRNIRRRM